MQDITVKIQVLKQKHVTGHARLGNMLIKEIITPDGQEFGLDGITDED